MLRFVYDEKSPASEPRRKGDFSPAGAGHPFINRVAEVTQQQEQRHRARVLVALFHWQ